MAQVISIQNQPDNALKAGVETLQKGQVVAMPTETVYGLAADATRPDAITAIYETKGRPRFNPLICHMASLEMALEYGEFDTLSLALAQKFWPGPLTLVVKLKAESPIHGLATAGLDTVGLRVPHGFAARLIAAFGRPLAAPSANSSGRISPTLAAHVEADLGPRIPLILDGGPAGIGVESTIVKVDNGQIHLLRPGGIATDEIEAFCHQSVIRPQKAGAIIEAPGMLASHYAPNATLRLEALEVSADEAVITFGDFKPKNLENAGYVLNLSAKGNLAEAAANLFAMMKQADKSGFNRMAITPIPQTGLGEAINDRLSRAAAPR